MSTNKTEHYQLHSWVPQDDFHMSEINENFALLDAALKAEAGSAAQKQAALESAMETALGERVRMITGKYSGNSIDTTSSQVPRQITLGFRPRAVVIINTYRGISDTDMSFLAVESNADSSVVALTDTGFTVANRSSRLNYSSTTYHYAAFY